MNVYVVYVLFNNTYIHIMSIMSMMLIGSRRHVRVGDKLAGDSSSPPPLYVIHRVLSNNIYEPTTRQRGRAKAA